jgi:hypothetical protein
MKLKVIGRYRSRAVEYTAGQIIDVPEAEARLLLADAPGCFEVAGEVQAEALDAPPKDKMLRPRQRKA